MFRQLLLSKGTLINNPAPHLSLTPIGQPHPAFSPKNAPPAQATPARRVKAGLVLVLPTPVRSAYLSIFNWTILNLEACSCVPRRCAVSTLPRKSLGRHSAGPNYPANHFVTARQAGHIAAWSACATPTSQRCQVEPYRSNGKAIDTLCFD